MKICVLPLRLYPLPSRCQAIRSSTTAGAATFAPRGKAGILMGNGDPVSGMKVVNEICVPSGDQRIPPGDRSRFVSCLVSRVSSHITWIWFVPLLSDRKAILLPSGDQIGDDTSKLPVSSSLIRRVARSMIISSLLPRSFILSTPPRVKRMWFPSGEILGLPTDSISM